MRIKNSKQNSVLQEPIMLAYHGPRAEEQGCSLTHDILSGPDRRGVAVC